MLLGAQMGLDGYLARQRAESRWRPARPARGGVPPAPLQPAQG
jgi:hypothetical protein